MRSFRLTALALALSLPTAAYLSNQAAFAQNTVSGEILGSVTDPTGAAIPGASVVLVGTSTGSSAKFTTNAGGQYHFSFLKPGAYKITITAPNFSTTTLDVSVSQGATTAGDVKLGVGKSTTVVEVGADTVPLLQTEDAQLSTTFNMEQVQALPNPGGDITYYAQTAPGVVMNTGGGYGNFSAFGLPGTSNNFTVNGEQENDPFLNLNNSGPTNLLLGQNDIASVNVITNAYNAEFGSFGGAQINETSRSGNNKFHGDASYYWSGRTLDANEWFYKANEVGSGLANTTPFSNNNQWSASVSGPIVKDKLFFFVDTEGIRFITASPTQVFIPSAQFQASVIGPNGDCASGSLLAAGNADECPYYQTIFNTYNSAPGSKNRATYTGDATGNTDTYNYAPSIFAKESLLTARVDYVIGAKDTVFAHFKYDNGTQPSYTDPISPQFNDISKQPEDEGQIVETHTFGPNLVNQFLGTVAHYVAVFSPVSANPNPLDIIFLDEPFNGYNGAFNYVFPQGRNATQYQIADDLAYTKNKHTLKFGYAFKKDDITDFDTQVLSEISLGLVYAADFAAGYSTAFEQSYPLYKSVGVGLYSEGFYAQDTWKPTPGFTLTAGIRLEHNSNPVSPRGHFSRLSSSVADYFGSTAAQDPTTPYNQLVSYGLNKAFAGFQSISYEPRVEFIKEITSKTILRGGFGMFSDVFPGTVADSLLSNVPSAPVFAIYGATLEPGLATSGEALAAASAQQFQTGAVNFYNGGSLATLAASNPGFTVPSITTVAPKISFPTYEEYSLQLQHQINKNTSVQLAYVGNHGYHEPVDDSGLNATNGGVTTSSGAAFVGLPSVAPSASFGGVTQISSGATSNYNGVSVSIIHRSKIFEGQINYTYSHALDQISNGGFLGFTSSSITGPLKPGTLAYNYGNADEDVRNSLNGNYLVRVPSYGSGWVKSLTGGFQLAGTVFYRSGFPFTVVDSAISGGFQDYGSGAVPAALTNSAVPRHCSQSSAYNGSPKNVDCLGGVNGTTGAINDFADPTDFIANQRNAYSGPHYFNTDMTINKAFAMPHYESAKILIGVNAYNILNHPNFANPSSDIGNPSTFGYSFATVSVPTSIYGSGLGASASPRILQLHAKVTF